jgi:hypothetical protein
MPRSWRYLAIRETEKWGKVVKFSGVRIDEARIAEVLRRASAFGQVAPLQRILPQHRR